MLKTAESDGNKRPFPNGVSTADGRSAGFSVTDLLRRIPIAMPLPAIPARCYPCYYACHLAHVAGTAHVEGLGLAINGAAPAGIGPLLPNFVTAVCHWGGGHGYHIAPNVLNPANNPMAFLIDRFNASIALLAAANLGAALNSLTELRGLGISFASKHLRMLRPDLCGVFDGLVAGAGLDYALGPAGFADYSTDCATQANVLNAARIVTSNGGHWNAGAVDMAVFAWIMTGRGDWNCDCRLFGHPLSQVCGGNNLPRPAAPVQSRGKKRPSDLNARTYKSVCEKPAANSAHGRKEVFLKLTKAHYIAVKLVCGESSNWGALETLPNAVPDGTLNARRAMVDEIAAAGGNFLALPGFNAALAPGCPTRRVGGSGYEGWRELGSVDTAIRYLQGYFVVRVCNLATRDQVRRLGGPLLPL